MENVNLLPFIVNLIMKGINISQKQMIHAWISFLNLFVFHQKGILPFLISVDILVNQLILIKVYLTLTIMNSLFIIHLLKEILEQEKFKNVLTLISNIGN